VQSAVVEADVNPPATDGMHLLWLQKLQQQREKREAAARRQREQQQAAARQMKEEADARREAELAARECNKAAAAERQAQREAAAHAAQEQAKVCSGATSVPDSMVTSMDDSCTGAASLATPSWHCDCSRLLTAPSSCSAV
jgi:hypothetical protein